ncbi:MAG: 16S rRNA (guanine(966)-N(2))-methyltransferase RsmD [Candidatus Omnitrophota bacterium]
MRIVSGKFKGRVIEMPKDIRPTSDKVRAALFNILRGRTAGARFLDLYCGSGAIGIEALSQGASKAVFVDSDFKSIHILKKNLAGLNIKIDTIYNKDGIKAIDLFKASGERFDIVFLDPPYNKDMAKNTLIKISACDILTPNAVVVAEIFKKESLPERIGALIKSRTYKYGDTVMEFYTL